MSETSGGEKGFVNVPVKINEKGRPEISVDDVREELRKGVIPMENNDNVINVDFQSGKKVEE